MFVKFTRKDGSPIWLNASFVVTVEPVKGGGSIVVPVGDGLDYEVREGVEQVVAAVESAQGGVSVVPVPATDALTAKPEDLPNGAPDGAQGTFEVVSGGAEETSSESPAFEASSEGTALTEAEAAAGVAAVAAFNELQEKAKEAKPAKRTRKAKTKPAAPGVPATEGERKAPARRRAARKTPLELSDEQVVRLRKMAPRSVKKLTNVLKEKQFDSPDAEKTIKALVEHGIISVDDKTQHVEWLVAAEA